MNIRYKLPNLYSEKSRRLYIELGKPGNEVRRITQGQVTISFDDRDRVIGFEIEDADEKADLTGLHAVG